MNSLVSNNRRSASGSVLVEFAIVLPLLLMLLIGIAELGRALYQLNGLTKAAVSGARYLARQHGAVSFDEASGNCGQDAAWDATAASNVVIYGNDAGTGEALYPGITATFGLESSGVIDIDGAQTAGCVITAEVSMDFVSVMGDGEVLIPFADISADLLPITLTANVEERYIGE